jgi:phosphate starvation-inducible PhoH-like protein
MRKVPEKATTLVEPSLAANAKHASSEHATAQALSAAQALAAQASAKGTRTGRKSKKQNEKEIMNEYYSSLEDNAAATSEPGPFAAAAGAFHHLSSKERAKLEEKFTSPKNPNQEALVRMLRDKNKKIIFVTGPAGTGKTLFATETGVRHWLTGVYDKLVFTRPNIAVDEELGFLPGTLEEKMGPYVRPIYDIVNQFVSPKELQGLIEDKTVEIAPLGFMRGRTFKNSWIVADEMQNATVSQMKMLLTRVGENSQLVITGDLEQSDIGPHNGLSDFLGRWKAARCQDTCRSIGHIQFDVRDVLREAVVQEILDIYNGNCT